MEFRPFRPEDKPGVIALIDGIYAEYGDRVHLGGAEADLEDIPSHYAPGHFMVLHDSAAIRATVACSPDADRPGVLFLKRLYLDAALRGTGEGERLLQWCLATARDAGMRRVELWSDVRFERAHAFYRKHGFHHDGQAREMNDSWEPYREYFYFLHLDPPDR